MRLDRAVEAAGISQVKIRHRPRLLSDNGPRYVSGELEAYLRRQGLEHVRGAPYQPMTR